MNARTRLVLWDLDHTLIETRGVGRDIYERIFPRATGQPLRELATVHGRTELDIIAERLEAHGIPATDQAVMRLAEVLAEGYREATDELARRGRVLPGARETLAMLAAQPHVHQTLLTGNTTSVAAIKVQAFDLDPYLDLTIGAYGDDHRDRVALVAVARERAKDRLGTPIAADQAVIIGDTPNDVAAALGADAQLIAVASGKYAADELASGGASHVLRDLADPTEVRQACILAGLVLSDARQA